MKKIRSIEDFRDSLIVFVPESNLGNEGWHLGELLEQESIPHVCVLKEDVSEGIARPGIRINDKLKERLVWILEEKFTGGSAYLHEKFFSVSQKQPSDMLDEIENQLINFARKEKRKNDPDLPPRILFQGKSGYGYDDVVCAWFLIPLAKKAFERNPQYARWRENIRGRVKKRKVEDTN